MVGGGDSLGRARGGSVERAVDELGRRSGPVGEPGRRLVPVERVARDASAVTSGNRRGFSIDADRRGRARSARRSISMREHASASEPPSAAQACGLARTGRSESGVRAQRARASSGDPAPAQPGCRRRARQRNTVDACRAAESWIAVPTLGVARADAVPTLGVAWADAVPTLGVVRADAVPTLGVVRADAVPTLGVARAGAVPTLGVAQALDDRRPHPTTVWAVRTVEAIVSGGSDRGWLFTFAVLAWALRARPTPRQVEGLAASLRSGGISARCSRSLRSHSALAPTRPGQPGDPRCARRLALARVFVAALLTSRAARSTGRGRSPGPPTPAHTAAHPRAA